MPPIESKGMVEGYEYGTAGEPINQRRATARRITPWTEKPTSLQTGGVDTCHACESNPCFVPWCPSHQAFASPRPASLGRDSSSEPPVSLSAALGARQPYATDAFPAPATLPHCLAIPRRVIFLDL